jgi:hypothetical protein
VPLMEVRLVAHPSWLPEARISDMAAAVACRWYSSAQGLRTRSVLVAAGSLVVDFAAVHSFRTVADGNFTLKELSREQASVGVCIEVWSRHHS